MKKLRGLKRNDLQLDFNLYRREVPIAGVSGANLSVIDIWPEATQKTIMFVHGYAGVAETWEYQINYFSRSYRVVAPDLRGHGQSDAPYTQYTMNELVADLQNVVEYLQLPEKFILVGHSFGGSICVEYANAYPERLEKLILVATAGEYPLPRVVNVAYRIPTWFYRLWWDYRPKWNAEVHVMKRMMFNNMRRWRGWPLLRNIQIPTLVITGERDTYFPRSVFEEVAKMIPNAEVYDVGSAKHKVQLERHRAVNRAIERFIEGDKRSWRDVDEQSALIQRRPWLLNYSKETPWTIPVPRQPLYKFLEGAADWVPKRIATNFYGQQLTYQQLLIRVNQFANVLHGLGVRPGDRVMIVLPNTPSFVIAYYATLKIGGVVVLPNPDATSAQLMNDLTETEAKVLITTAEFRRGEFVRQADKNPTVKAIILVDLQDTMPKEAYQQLMLIWNVPSFFSPPQLEKAQYMHLMTEDTAVDVPQVEIDPNSLAAIIYTSGTTDEPKGVCLSHTNLIANALQTRHWIPDLQYGTEIFLSVVPFLHSYGMTSAMNIPIAMGATLVMLPYFAPNAVLQAIKKYRPTIFPGVPTMYTQINLVSDVRSYGLSSIKACISGAAPLPVEVQEAFEKLTHGRLVEGYGLTEASPVTHANPLYGVRKVGSIGVAIPNTDAKIVDLETLEPVPSGEIGELWVSGPQVMQGYWRDDAATKVSITEDGWLRTGDIATMDGDGYVRIISRKQEIMWINGKRIFPRDIEEVLYEHNKVVEAAVVAVPNEADNEIHAFIVLKADAHVSAQDLIEWCEKRLPSDHVPHAIHFRDTLPKSFVGKVLRRALR